MRRPSKPMTQLPSMLLQDATDVDTMLAKCYHVLQREVANLMTESFAGKLGKSSASDLVAYIKLLSDMKMDESALLSVASEEQLNEIIKGAGPQGTSKA